MSESLEYEKKELLGKETKAKIAISVATFWLLNKTLGNFSPVPFSPGMPGSELSREDEKSVEDSGWLKTAFEKAKGAYQWVGKAEEIIGTAVDEQGFDWDKIFGDDK